MDTEESTDTCIICHSATADGDSICCPRRHHICRQDLNQYMSHNVLSQIYKLKFNKCEVACPEVDCKATFDIIELFERLDVNERRRFEHIAASLAADGESPIPRIKNGLLDSLSLKCPHCDTAVDPSPDACSAVSCLSCGFFYCNCCFKPFGKGHTDRGSRAAHEHCAEHDMDRPQDQRSAFLPLEVIVEGHRKVKLTRFVSAARQSAREGADRREVLLAAVLCHDELRDAGINLRETRLTNALQVLSSVAEAETAVDADSVESSDCSSDSEESGTGEEDEEDPVRRQLMQLANAMHQENTVATTQLLASIEDSALDPNFICGHCGETLLILALHHGDRLVSKALLTGDKGADPKSLLLSGPFAGKRSALHIVVEKGYVIELRLMMEMPGVSWDSQVSFGDEFGLTALHVAVQWGQLAAVMYLVEELHADVNVPAALSSITPVMTAVQFGRDDILEYLMLHGGQLNVQTREGRYPIYLAIEKGYANIVKYLVDVCSVDLKEPTTSEPTRAPPLWIAVHCDKSFLVPLLINLGADVNAKDDEFGFTPLHYAVLRGVDDAVELMLLSGADPHALSKYGRTAMWMAAELGHRGIVRMLVEKCDNGIDVLLNAPCATTNEYPIHVATQFNKPEVVAVMLNLGVDLSVTTENGLTSMDIAISQRPALDNIILLYGSYAERKSILDSAVRRQMPMGRGHILGHRESTERGVGRGEASLNSTGMMPGIGDDLKIPGQPQGKQSFSKAKVVAIVSAFCTLALSFSAYYCYGLNGFSANHANKQ